MIVQLVRGLDYHKVICAGTARLQVEIGIELKLDSLKNIQRQF